MGRETVNVRNRYGVVLCSVCKPRHRFSAIYYLSAPLRRVALAEAEGDVQFQVVPTPERNPSTHPGDYGNLEGYWS